MTTQNYKPKLQMVKERLTKIDEIMEKFKYLPDVQEKLLGAKVALQESEEEIMNYYDMKDLSKHGLN